MDVIPKPTHALKLFDNVEDFRTTPYDEGSFREYPQRRGFDYERLIHGNLDEHPSDETVCFFQNWLVFGVLHQCFYRHLEVLLDHTWTLEDHTGKRLISTAQLEHRLRLLWERIQDQDSLEKDEGSETWIRDLNSCLDDSCTLSNFLRDAETHPRLQVLASSIKVMGAVIDHWLRWRFKLEVTRDWSLKVFAAQAMVFNGWCQRDISYASEFLSDISMLYAASLDRGLTGDHSHCTTTTCNINQIDEDTYQPKHRTAGCQCQHWGPDPNKLRAIVAKGETPVIAMRPQTLPDGSQRLHLDVIAVSIKNPTLYVTVSHVWSDGLGSAKRNSLPLCQLQWLYDTIDFSLWGEMKKGLDRSYELKDPDMEFLDKAVSKYLKPGVDYLVNKYQDVTGHTRHLWIDSLCIPMDRKWRNVSLMKLRRVYANSVAALVLDSELQTLSIEDCAPEEVFMRVALSGWMRRAWTFQEAVISNRRLKIKFADKTLDFPYLLEGDDYDDDTGGIEVFQNKFSGVRAIQSMNRWMDKMEQKYPDANRLAREKLARERAEDFSLTGLIRSEALKFFQGIMQVWSIPPDPKDGRERVRRIVAAWESLRWRSSTKEGDKILNFAHACVAAREDSATANALAEIPTEKRMAYWIARQPVLPVSLLFTPGPKIDEDGLRWAPVGVHRGILDTGDDCVILRSPGILPLTLQRPGYLLSLTLTALPPRLRFIDAPTGQSYDILFDSTYPPPWTAYTETLGLVLQRALTPRTKTPAVLISTDSMQAGTLHGVFQCVVEVCPSLADREIIAIEVPSIPRPSNSSWCIQ